MPNELDLFQTVREKPLLTLIAGGVVIVLGLLLSDVPTMVVSQGWPSTDGKIITNRLVGTSFEEYDGDYYTETQVYIRYQYAVDGISYTSARLNSIDPHFSLYSPGFSDRYPLDKDVLVYYLPLNPAVAVLEPGFVFDLGAFDIYSSLTTGIGIYIVIRGYSEARKINKMNLK